MPVPSIPAIDAVELENSSPGRLTWPRHGDALAIGAWAGSSPAQDLTGWSSQLFKLKTLIAIGCHFVDFFR